MHISFKNHKIYFTLCCSTCLGHHCVHHQELLIAAHAVSGHRVVLGRLFPPALFCCYYTQPSTYDVVQVREDSSKTVANEAFLL
jgi:hypothetical protein